MRKYAAFYETKEGENIFWFCVAENEQEAREEFLKDYNDIGKEMVDKGYHFVEVPSTEFLLTTKKKVKLIDVNKTII